MPAPSLGAGRAAMRAISAAHSGAAALVPPLSVG